jgi:hypothetical protein
MCMVYRRGSIWFFTAWQTEYEELVGRFVAPPAPHDQHPAQKRDCVSLSKVGINTMPSNILKTMTSQKCARPVMQFQDPLGPFLVGLEAGSAHIAQNHTCCGNITFYKYT